MDPEASSIGLTSKDKNFKTENAFVKNTQCTKRKSQFKAPTSQKRKKIEQGKDNSKVDENGALKSSIKTEHPIQRSMRNGNVKTGVANTSETNKENEGKWNEEEKDSNANILNIIPKKVFVSLEKTFFSDDVCNSNSYKDIAVKDNNILGENKIIECSEANEDEKILGDKNSNNDAVVTEQNTTIINDSQTDIENAQVDYDKPQLESKSLKAENILQKNKNDEIQNSSNEQSEANGNKDTIQKENGRTEKIIEKENFVEKNNSELATTVETEHLRILTGTAQNLVINENQENIFSNSRSIKNIKDANNENGCEKTKDIPMNEFSQIDKNLDNLYIDIKEADKIINMLSVSNNMEEISYDLNEIVNHSVSVFENSKQNNIFFNGIMLEKDNSSVSENYHSSPGKKNEELKVKSTINMEDKIISNENDHLSSHIIKGLDVNSIINMDNSDSADSINLNLDKTSNFQKLSSVGSNRDIEITESEINTSLDNNCDLGTKGMKQNLLQNNKESLNTESNRNSDNEFLDNGINASEESFKIIGQQSTLQGKNKEICDDIITMKTEANMTKKNQEANKKILAIPHMAELQVWKAMPEKSQANDETSTLFDYSEMHLDTFKKNEGGLSSYEDKLKINVDKSTSEEKSTENIPKKGIAKQKTLTIPHMNAIEVWKAMQNKSDEKDETYTSFCHSEMHSDTFKIKEEESSYEDKFKVNVEKLTSEDKSTENISKQKTLTIPHMNAMEIWKAMQNKSDEKDENSIVNYFSNDIQEKNIFCTDEDDGEMTDEHKINTKGNEEHKIIKDETINAKNDEISEQRNAHDSQNLSNKEYHDQNITQENPNTLMYELNSVKSVNIEQLVINGNEPEMKKDLYGKKDEINIAQEPSQKEADKIYNKNTLKQSQMNNTIEVDKLNDNIEVNTEETDMCHVNKYLDEDITAADYFKSELNSKIDNGVITNENTTDTREIEAANTDIEDNFDFDDDFNLTASQLNMIEDNESQTKESGTTKVNFCQQTESCGSTHFGLDSVTVEVIDQLCYIRESVESIKGLLSALLNNANLKKIIQSDNSRR